MATRERGGAGGWGSARDSAAGAGAQRAVLVRPVLVPRNRPAQQQENSESLKTPPSKNNNNSDRVTTATPNSAIFRRAYMTRR